MDPTPAVVGVADHDGWASLVTVAVRDGLPVAIDRRQAALIDPALPSQPFRHATTTMPLADAEALVQAVRGSIAEHARAALGRLAADIGPQHTLIAMAIRMPPSEPPPRTVAEARIQRSMVQSADAMLYHQGLRAAARDNGLQVRHHESGDEAAMAAKACGLGAEETQTLLMAMGAALGAPWTGEHKACAAAAIAQWIHFKRLSEAP